MTSRSVRVAAGALLLALPILLSGCFVIPLADGRSPFDDPFGPSIGDVEKTLPAIREALEGIDAEGLAMTAEVGSDDCEGACNVSPEVWIRDADEAARLAEIESDETTPDLAVPAETIAEVLDAVIPLVGEMPLRLSAGLGAQLDAYTEVLGDLDVEGYDGLFIAPDELDAAQQAAQAYLAAH